MAQAPGTPFMNQLRPEAGQGGMILLRSTLLASIGVPHAFSTAVGPEGRPLDLSSAGSSHLGTRAEVLRNDLERFSAAVAPGGRLATTRQVHGAAITDVQSANTAEADIVIAEPLEDDDRVVRMAAVRTADCVPILLACPRSGRVAAVHAGWRGLVADAPAAAIEEMSRRGSRIDDLHVAIGPAIGVERFEIGLEVAAAMRDSGLAAAVQSRSPRPHADLHRATCLRVIAAGVRESLVDGAPECTASSFRFFSHRRDRGATGRHLAAITPGNATGFEAVDMG